MKLESDTYPSPNHHKIIHQNHKSPTAQEKKTKKQKKSENKSDRMVKTPAMSSFWIFCQKTEPPLSLCALGYFFSKVPQRSLWEVFLLSSFKLSAEKEDGYYGLALHPDRPFSHALL